MGADERKKRILELKQNQNKNLLYQCLKENNFPDFHVENESTVRVESLWEKINKGKLLCQLSNWDQHFLESIIIENFQHQKTVVVDYDLNDQTFFVHFHIKDILNVFRNLVTNCSNESLFSSFFFSADLSIILLIIETEYEEFEVFLYKEQ